VVSPDLQGRIDLHDLPAIRQQEMACSTPWASTRLRAWDIVIPAWRAPKPAGTERVLQSGPGHGSGTGGGADAPIPATGGGHL
jgi:hypothetical protein